MPVHKRRIDVWWQGDDSSRLMLLLAYLMTRSDAWEEANIRVLAAGSRGLYEQALDFLEETLKEVRITAEPEVVECADADAILEQSSNAAMVFLPFHFRKLQWTGPFGSDIEPLIPRLPTTALCLAARDIGLDAEPEEGKAGEIAAALNALEEAEKEAGEAEKVADRESAAADEAFRRLIETARSRGETERMEKQETAVLESQYRARQAARRSARLQTQVESARRTLEELGGQAPSREESSEPTGQQGEK
jgi:hypothetical protein